MHGGSKDKCWKGWAGSIERVKEWPSRMKLLEGVNVLDFSQYVLNELVHSE
jgi:hypothetical protein